MNMPAREAKWAAGGFAGGFLFCYLLIGAFQPRPAAPPLLASAKPTAAWPPVPAVPAVPIVQATNLELPEFHIQSPPRWLGPGLPPPGVVNPGYSLDLIDTHY